MRDLETGATALWSLLIIAGLARLATSLGRWPRAVSAEESGRAAAISHMEGRLLGAAFSAGLLTLGIAGVLRSAHLAVRLHLWVALVALLAGWLINRVGGPTAKASRELRLARFRRCVQVAVWATLASAVAWLARGVMHGFLSLWLTVAVVSLFYMAARVSALLDEIARDLLS